MTKNYDSVEVDQADSENVLAKVDTNGREINDNQGVVPF